MVRVRRVWTIRASGSVAVQAWPINEKIPAKGQRKSKNARSRADRDWVWRSSFSRVLVGEAFHPGKRLGCAPVRRVPKQWCAFSRNSATVPRGHAGRSILLRDMNELAAAHPWFERASRDASNDFASRPGIRLHVDRTPGGHRHHRAARHPAAADLEQGQGTSSEHRLHKQPEAAHDVLCLLRAGQRRLADAE